MTFIETIINAIGTGLGCAIGTWIASRALIKNIEKAEGRLKKIRKSNGEHISGRQR